MSHVHEHKAPEDQGVPPGFTRPPPFPSLNWRMPLAAHHRAIHARALSLSAAELACINRRAAELIRCIA